MSALVRASLDSLSVCGGTTIATNGRTGVLLTAAHCVVAVDPGTGQVARPLEIASPEELLVVPGDDWLVSAESREFYPVLAVHAHPQYDGLISSPYDIAVLEYAGATPDTPTIPVLSAAADDLRVGSDVTLVGYGVTETNERNTRRLSVPHSVAELSSQQILNDQTNGTGTCRGDSGGPVLYATPDGERVAGVTSFGDSECVLEGISVRASAYGSFISGALARVPPALSCESCAAAVSSPGNTCRASSVACSEPAAPCAELLACLERCGDSATCIQRCETQWPQGVTAYLEYVSCVCEGGCSSECAGSDVCGEGACGGVAATDPECNACIKGSCCAEAATCADDAQCSRCIGSPQASCASSVTYVQLTACLAECEDDPCGVGSASPGAGVGGTAQSGGGAGRSGGGGRGGTGDGGRPSSGGRPSVAGPGGSPSVNAGAGGALPIGPSGGGASGGGASGGRAGGPPSAEAGERSTDDPEGSSVTCSCNTPGRRSESFAWPLAACLALGAAYRARRRPASRTP